MIGSVDPIAVLCSGGLDSAVLLAGMARESDVQPIYVSVGLAWETAKLDGLRHLAATPAFRVRVRPMVRLDVTRRDMYPTSHRAVRGTPPAYDTPDGAGIPDRTGGAAPSPRRVSPTGC